MKQALRALWLLATSALLWLLILFLGGSWLTLDSLKQLIGPAWAQLALGGELLLIAVLMGIALIRA